MQPFVYIFPQKTLLFHAALALAHAEVQYGCRVSLQIPKINNEEVLFKTAHRELVSILET